MEFVTNEFSPLRKADKQAVLAANFEYLSWDYFDSVSEFLPKQQIPSDLFRKVTKKSKIIYISHRWYQTYHPDPSGMDWELIKKQSPVLAKDFDGFFMTLVANIS